MMLVATKKWLEKNIPFYSFGAVVGSVMDKNQHRGSGINIPDPQHCLQGTVVVLLEALLVGGKALSQPGIQ
jgi:hypothetical protein